MKYLELGTVVQDIMPNLAAGNPRNRDRKSVV